MFQVSAEGRTLNELKKAVADIHKQLIEGNVAGKMTRDMSVDRTLKEAMVEQAAETPAFDETGVEQALQVHKEFEESIKPFAVPKEMLQPTAVYDGPITQPPVEQPIEIIHPEISPIDGAELDNEGLPWDMRIHSSGKTKYQKTGCWIKRKKTDAEYITRIKNELRQSMHNAANRPATPPAPINETTPIIQPVVEAPVVVQPVEPIVTPVEAVVVQPVEPIAAPPVVPGLGVQGHSLATFTTNFPLIISNLITEKKITQDYVNTLMSHFKVTQIWEISDEQKSDVFDSLIISNLITRLDNEY